MLSVLERPHRDRSSGGAKRCVWHPQWLINRAASKLAPRQLRGCFLGKQVEYLCRPRGQENRPIRVRTSTRPREEREARVVPVATARSSPSADDLSGRCRSLPKLRAPYGTRFIPRSISPILSSASNRRRFTQMKARRNPRRSFQLDLRATRARLTVSP